MQPPLRTMSRGRVLAQVRRRLRSALDASRRHHVADVRFYELLSEPDVTSGSVKLRRHPRR